MSNPHVPLFAVATVNDDVLPETTDPDFSFDYVDISSISDFHVSDTLARFTFREAPSRARRLAQPGDIALSTVRTYLRAIAPITEQNADSVFSTGFAIIRPKPSVLNSSFLRYAALSTDFIDSIVSHSNGVSYPAINATDVMRFRIPLPPPDTQQRIADYLDRETAEIDAAVAELDRYVELLERKRSSVTQHFLSLTLSSAEIRPIWSLFAPIKLQNYPEEPVLSVYRDHGVIPKDSRDDNLNRTPEDVSTYQLVEVNDLVVNKMKAWQGSLAISNYRGIVSPDYQVAKPITNDLPRYLHYALRNPDMIGLYRNYSKGIRPAQWRLYWEELSRLTIPVPSIQVQHQIVEDLDEKLNEIGALAEESTKLRDLLLKRRSVLITDVVTGRKQV